jgi:hypothetical protein
VTVHTVLHSEVGSAIPRLLQHDTVAVLTPGRDALWAGMEAWVVARAIARRDRTVALIDLCIGHPALDIEPDSGDRVAGVVDAFLHGTPLPSVVRRSNPPHLFFVGVGTRPADPLAIWSHERLGRLRDHFVRENALLLLYAPAEAIEHLRVRPDRIVVLSAEEGDSTAWEWGAVHQVPVTYLLPDPPTPRIQDTSIGLWSAHITRHWVRPSRRRRLVTAALAVILALGAALFVWRWL